MYYIYIHVFIIILTVILTKYCGKIKKKIQKIQEDAAAEKKIILLKSSRYIVPAVFAWITIFVGLLFVAGVDDAAGDIIIYWISGIVALMFDLCIVLWPKDIIWYDENGFSVGWYPRFRKDFQYSDVLIEDIRGYKDWYKIYTDVKVLSVEYYTTKNKTELLELRKLILDSQDEEQQLKLSYLKQKMVSPAGICGMCIVLVVLCVFLMIASNWHLHHEPKVLTRISCSFDSYEIAYPTENTACTLLLYSNDYELPFKISYYDSYHNLPLPDFFCNGDTYIMEVDSVKSGYFIYGLSDAAGKTYISAESKQEAFHENQRGSVILLNIICMIGIGYGVLGIVVTRHPERYGEEVTRLFLRKGVVFRCPRKKQ